jgi:hypothetical protein
VKKLVVAVGLTAVFLSGTFLAVMANGSHSQTGFSGSTDTSIGVLRDADQRLAFTSDDSGLVDDWLCDGMTPCVELSPRQGQ